MREVSGVHKNTSCREIFAAASSVILIKGGVVMKLTKIKIIIFITLSLTVSFMMGFSFPGQARILSEDEMISITIDHNDSSVIYVASNENVYKTVDGGESWQKIFSIRKANKKINKICLDPKIGSVLYVLTQEGAYINSAQGDNWQSFFKGSSDLENNCLSICLTTTAIFLGTEGGLFISSDQGKSWQKSFEQFSESIVSSIVGNDEVIYAASERGIFTTEDNGKNWKRVYVVYSSENPSEDYDDYDGEVSDQVLNIKSMVLSNNKLFIATTKGILFTEDKGEKWQNITRIGLPSLDIRSMQVSSADDRLYAATDKGIFRLEGNSWRRVGGALYKEFNDLCIYDNGIMLAAGKGGVYRLDKEELTAELENIDYSQEDIENLFAGEPTIEQIQRAAIEYSETSMDKIYSWRKHARLKALFPAVSLGYDKTIYGSSSGAIAIGPRAWDVQFSWDASDLIWSTDQTSIDARSRLNVQLRQDVLDQVTNLYYERQRLKAEMMLLPSVDDVEELYRNFEIQQVTANIDSLTDNYFSRFIKKNKT
jgi:photosystem II stability/assembly factor-like uncharacterized protein